MPEALEIVVVALLLEEDVEGRAGQQWVLIDGGNVMIHVFLEEKRHYYDLERLWHDAPKVPLAA